MVNFMGASSPLEEADMAIFGCPLSTNQMRLSELCNSAMRSVRLAAMGQNGYSFQLEKDISDKKCVDLGDPGTSESEIEKTFLDLVEKNILPIAVAENPVVALSAIKAVSHLEGVELLCFGACPRLSLLQGFQEIFEGRKGVVRLAGTRTASKEEHEYIKEHCELVGVHPDVGLGLLAWDWAAQNTPVFMVFDMNTINTNRAREVLEFVPGGVSVTKALEALTWCASRIKNLVGVCFVGFQPNRTREMFNDTHQIAVFLLREFMISYGD